MMSQGMRKLILIVLVVLGVHCGLRAQSAADLIQKAETAYRQGSYADATRAYESLQKQGYSHDGRVFYNLGNCAFRLRQYSKALLHYERALRLPGSKDQVRFNRDLCLDRLGMGGRDREGLLSSLRRRLASLDSMSWFQLGLVFEALGLILLWLTLRRSTGFRLVGTLVLLALGSFAHYHALTGSDAETKGVVVLEDRTALRSEPRQDLDALLFLPTGQRAPYLEDSGAWVKIRVSTAKGDTVGWIQRSRVGLY